MIKEFREFIDRGNIVDAAVGRLLEKIRALGLLENTYVFYLSDNGGRSSLPGSKELGLGLNHPLRGAKSNMYEGGIRVPFFVVGPGVKAGSVSAVPVTGLDFLPTMAELAGYQPALPATIDGGSLTSVLRNAGVGEVKRQRPYLIFHQAVDRNAQSALRWGNLKLVKTWKTGKLELFDLANEQRIVGHRFGQMAKECGAAGIVDGRNALAKFMCDEATDVDWLFMVDSDMGFAGDTVERLIAAADPEAVKDYLRFRVLANTVDLLSTEIVEANFQFAAALTAALA